MLILLLLLLLFGSFVCYDDDFVELRMVFFRGVFGREGFGGKEKRVSFSF